MYLAGTTRGGAGGVGTLDVCAGCCCPSVCSCCGGGTGRVGSLTVRDRCASAAGESDKASTTVDRILLAFFIASFRVKGETFRVRFRDATGRAFVARREIFSARTGAAALPACTRLPTVR